VLSHFLSATVVSISATVRLIVLNILSQVDAKPALYGQQMEAHSASILSVAEFMSNLDVGYAYLRMVLHLKVVNMLALKAEQRAQARRLLEVWKEKGGLRGICEVALLGMEEDMGGVREGAGG